MNSTDVLTFNPNTNLSPSMRGYAMLRASDVRSVLFFDIANPVATLQTIRQKDGEEVLNEVLYMLYVAAAVMDRQDVLKRLDEVVAVLEQK